MNNKEIILAQLSAVKKVVGAKQTAKAVEKNLALKVYLGNDADKHVLNPLLELCKNKKMEADLTYTMAELGKGSGLKVGAAAVAVVG